MGEISYITQALAAVLQLAVTMDYSIFLWHSYKEKQSQMPDKREAMAKAIGETITSVVSSSLTGIRKESMVTERTRQESSTAMHT